MAANTDKFHKTKARFSTTLSSSVTDSGTTLSCASLSGVPTDAAVNFVINRVDNSGAKQSTYETTTGVVSGNDITNAARGVEGTASAWSAGTVVEILWTADDVNDMVDGITTEHNQDGTHKDITADSVTTDTISEETSAAGVTVDGLNIRDGKLNTNDSVVTANITDSNVTSEKLSATVAFSAYRPDNNQLLGGTGADEIIQFNTEDFDIGSDFDTSTYKFTAPVDGIYDFGTTVGVDNLGDATYFEIVLYKNDVAQYIISRGHSSFSAGTQDDVVMSANMLLELSSGDTIDIRAGQGSGADHAIFQNSRFWGRLVSNGSTS